MDEGNYKPALFRFGCIFKYW